jgi:integrase
MKRQRLTAKFVENLRPGAKRRELSDQANGLFLISQPSGHRSWAVRYRHGGRSVKHTLGQWPAMTLADARKAAADVQHALSRGENPAKARQDAKVKADATRKNTLTAVCENYLKREGSKLRTLDQRVSILRRLIYPELGDKPIGSIKRSDLVALFDKIEDENGARAADVALAVLRRILRWHAIRDDEFITPVVPGMARQKPAEHRRDRILSDDELRALWTHTADGSTFSALVRFLLLTACRRGEGAALPWQGEIGAVRCTVKQIERGVEREVEVEFDNVWTLPRSRSKTKVEVIRPLSKAAMAIIAAQPQIDDCPYVFASSTGRTPIAQFSTPKARLDAASGIRNWHTHDLRRSARSLLSRAGVNSDVAEKCLGHSRGDIIERYDQHKYLAEMRHAFEALAAQIERIVNPPAAADVADMATERARRRRR